MAVVRSSLSVPPPLCVPGRGGRSGVLPLHPRNIRRLPIPPPHLLSSIRFIELPMPAFDGLPVDAESTTDLPRDLMGYLMVAFDKLRSPVADFLKDESPDLVLYDVICHWGAAAASGCGASCGVLSAFSAAAGDFIGAPWERLDWKTTLESLTSPPDWIPFPTTVAFKLREAQIFHAQFYGANVSCIVNADRVFRAFEEVEVVMKRTCRELEGEYLALLPSLVKKPVISTGFLPPAWLGAGGTPRWMEGRWGVMFEWLDAWDPRSVVYACFGSECALTRGDLAEVAHGLELTAPPFMWFLYRPAWLGSNEPAEAALPPGFASRNDGRGRGMVAVGWAPQREVVAHPSMGGALFHAGWWSTIETLQSGLVLILLPSVMEQGLNARLVVEKGLGFEVERDDDGSGRPWPGPCSGPWSRRRGRPRGAALVPWGNA